MKNNALIDRVIAEPLLIDPRQVSYLESSLTSFCTNHPEMVKEFQNEVKAGAIEDDEDFWGADWESYRPYRVGEDGILSIAISGLLLNKFPYQIGSWITGYEYIEKAIKRGLSDENVKGIALIVDSPGGVVAGNFELADYIFAARDEKPIKAFAYDSAYSAAYSLASAAQSISMTRSSGVGSIGVVTTHTNVGKRLEQMGVEVTFIYAGKHKVEGNAYEALSSSAKERIQARVDKLYGVFVKTVARNRGMEESSIRDTEALTYDSDDAIKIGLADSVGTFYDEFSIFSEELTEEYAMSKKDPQESAATVAETQAKAVSDAHAKGKVEGVAEGVAEGASAERGRIQGILALDESAKRGKAAMSVAMQTPMTVEEATTFLATLPEEQAGEVEAAAPTEHFSAAMGKENPEVGSGGNAPAEDATEDESATIKAAFGKASGVKQK